MIRIPDGNPFRIRLAARNLITGEYTEAADLGTIKSLVINYVRRGIRFAQQYTIDEEDGTALISNQGTLDCGIYGIELTGYYAGDPVRYYGKDMFEVTNETTDITDVSEDIDIEILMKLIASGVSKQYVDYTIKEKTSAIETEIESMGQAIEQAGKVDDVKVNGSSVVNQKVANINIPTNTSDLNNDSDFITSEQAQAKVDEAKINSATATYTDDGGSPEAAAEITDNTLNIHLKNLKLKFSDLTAEERQAITGPIGPQGESAVFDPATGNILAELENTTGYSSSNAMTQKAVTDKIDGETEVLEKIDVTAVKSQYIWINSTTHLWEDGTGATKRRSRIFNCEPGARYRFKVYPDKAWFAIAFLKTNNIEIGESPEYADGQDLIIDTRTHEVEYTAPDDAKYIYVYWMTGTSGNYYYPSVFKKVKSVRDIAQYVQENRGNYINIKEINAWNGYNISADGPVQSSTTALQLKKFEINSQKRYAANARIGSSQTGYSVAYFDENDNFIQWDINFGPRQTAVVAQLEKVNLAIPENAKYVYIVGYRHTETSAWPPMLFEIKDAQYGDVPKKTIVYNTVDVKAKVYKKENTDNQAEEIEKVKAGWAIMWPWNYTPKGKPTQIVAMLHGAEGYVSQSVIGYDNSTYKVWRSQYLSLGYAILDINGVGEVDGITKGESSQNDGAAKHYGGERAVEVLDKAFEYIKANFNVYDKMLIHGASMGGALAMAYAKNFPHKIEAVAVFAPIVSMRSATAFNRQDSTADNTLAYPITNAYGYSSAQEMIEDNYKQMVGYVPCANGMAIENGQFKIINWREFGSWDDAHQNGYEFNLIDTFPVPIRCWQGTADTTVPDWANKIIFDAFIKGGANASIKFWEGVGHEDCVGNSDSSGKLAQIKQEAFEWFEKFRK